MAVAVVRNYSEDGKLAGAHLLVWCPGCDDVHRVGVVSDDGTHPPVEWSWDRNIEAPTISPSIKTEGVQWAKSSPFYRPRHRVKAGGTIVCHSYVEAGRWRFLADCTHELVGQTVPMVDLPEWLTP